MKKKVIIIAEAGINHNGDVKIAYELIDIASKAKADYIKFQTYNTDDLVTFNSKKARYQNKSNVGNIPRLGKFPRLGSFPRLANFPRLGSFPRFASFPRLGNSPHLGNFRRLGNLP